LDRLFLKTQERKGGRGASRGTGERARNSPFECGGTRRGQKKRKEGKGSLNMVVIDLGAKRDFYGETRPTGETKGRERT